MNVHLFLNCMWLDHINTFRKRKPVIFYTSLWGPAFFWCNGITPWKCFVVHLSAWCVVYLFFLVLVTLQSGSVSGLQKLLSSVKARRASLFRFAFWEDYCNGCRRRSIADLHSHADWRQPHRFSLPNWSAPVSLTVVCKFFSFYIPVNTF